MCNIDLSNKNKFITLLAIIVYDTSHPLRHRVICGYEDIANVILDLHVNKKTYRDIIISTHGQIPEEDLIIRERELKKKVSTGISVFKNRLRTIY